MDEMNIVWSASASSMESDASGTRNDKMDPKT